MSVELNTRPLPVAPVGVRPLAPGEAGGESSSRLGPAQQNQVGAGLQLRFGPGARQTPEPEDKDDGPADRD